MNLISKDKNYTIRDGENYEVIIKNIDEQTPTNMRSVLALVGCLETKRSAIVAYYPDGSYLDNRKPHALDLIERMKWTSDLSRETHPLPKVGDSLKLQGVVCNIIAKVNAVGRSLTADILVDLYGEKEEAFAHKVAFRFDGTITIGNSSPFNLVPAFPLCSTWQYGDPLYVMTTPERPARRVTFVRLDCEERIVVLTEGGSGIWNTPASKPQLYSKFSVAVPEDSDIEQVASYGGWLQADKEKALKAVARMRLSWPKARKDKPNTR